MTSIQENRVIEIAIGALNGRLSAEQLNFELSTVKETHPSFNDLVNFLYHYSADEDIRGRDSGYAEFQRERLLELLRKLRPDI